MLEKTCRIQAVAVLKVVARKRMDSDRMVMIWQIVDNAEKNFQSLGVRIYALNVLAKM